MTIIGTGTKTAVTTFDATLKNHLRLFDDSDQTLVEHYISASGIYIEKYLGIPYFNPNLTIINRAIGCSVELPKSVATVTTVYERQSDMTWLAITPINVVFDNYGAWMNYYADNIKDGYEYKFEVTRTITITALVKEVAYLLIGEMYEERQNMGKNTKVHYPQANLLLDMEVTLI